MLDLPVIQMVRESDIATMVILCILAIMSLMCWGIIIVKMVFFRKNQHANALFYRKFEKIERFVDLKDLCDTSGTSALKSLTEEVLMEASKFSNFVSITF